MLEFQKSREDLPIAAFWLTFLELSDLSTISVKVNGRDICVNRQGCFPISQQPDTRRHNRAVVNFSVTIITNCNNCKLIWMIVYRVGFKNPENPLM